MYIPSYFKETDFPTLLSFMQQNSFCTLCTAGEGGPIATHLPFVVEERGSRVFLTSHMAKPNEQGKALEAGAHLLIIFQGPHAYVSPSNYELKQNVPTWNYIAVHAYGTAKMISSPNEVIAVLEKTIGTYEEAFMSQWKTLTDEYKFAMIKGITAFEIEVTKLEGKFKLSQNKTLKERENIIHSFEKSEDEATRKVAEEMKKRN
jgi:transcriptional regulator